MKLAYVSPYASNDVHAWSGLVFYIRKALEDADFEVETTDGLEECGRVAGKIKELAYRYLARKRFVRNRAPKVLDHYARQVEAGLARIDPDVIFSPGTVPLAHLETDRPIVFWTDATFAGLTDYYGLFSKLCRQSRRDGNRMEQAALDRCSLAIYSSRWAADTALQQYDVDPRKVKVVPFGANLVGRRTSEQVEKMLQQKDWGSCKLLFIGVEWERKGGSIALETARALNALGLRTELHVVGCEPPGLTPDFVIRHGFISKKSAEGRARLEQLLTAAHFLIVPSRAECYGLVYAEASAYGLPSLAADTGGVSSVVRNAVNGQLFPLEAGGEEYAEYIGSQLGSRRNYESLCRSSFNEYEEQLNWDVAGGRVAEMVRELR
ncbi:glycosyltransferase family 4 protein [Luteolibacter pohnpeiensis]|uniref:Glycosyltransferase family 4 protein n=1 Tax=Luteolibacter pohnpeiensis TaxID=454153 RepID=A0A934S9X5_9BACT|nr:glycosyltransferase family 4 protein [Luteolibacter pohnpeiensis]MBK1882342.1 glycosyltransferase family 4 protein [Luteolibacter pohnpeiensis]